jgi:AcrR family transcriptional regulator
MPSVSVRSTARSDGATSGRRHYRSALRAEQAERTRAALLDAAASLFVERGYAGTGMRDIATAAGVATETVYAHFSSKRLLFRAVADVAVVGDDAPLAVADRPEFAALGKGSRAERVGAAARLLAQVHERTARLARVLREAASSDDDIAEMLRTTRENQRRDVESGLALIMGRPPTARERDGVWAIASPEVYLLLVEESGWSVPAYEQWMASMLGRAIRRSSDRR